ncbi:melanin concentrating hormone receptor 2b isoform 2-T2 [Anableps anableps]
MNDTDIICENKTSSNFSDLSCLTPTAAPYSPIDITTFMHILPSIYGILCSVGVIANALVIYAVAGCKKKMVSDIYVLNLAIADMLFLLVMPFNIHQLVRDRQWVFGNFMCKAVVVVDVSNQFTTVGIVTVLCIDRYIAIVHPSSERRTVQWTIIINMLVWLGSFLLTVPVMIYAKVVRRQHFKLHPPGEAQAVRVGKEGHQDGADGHRLVPYLLVTLPRHPGDQPEQQPAHHCLHLRVQHQHLPQLLAQLHQPAHAAHLRPELSRTPVPAERSAQLAALLQGHRGQNRRLQHSK